MGVPTVVEAAVSLFNAPTAALLQFPGGRSQPMGSRRCPGEEDGEGELLPVLLPLGSHRIWSKVLVNALSRHRQPKIRCPISIYSTLKTTVCKSEAVHSDPSNSRLDGRRDGGSPCRGRTPSERRRCRTGTQNTCSSRKRTVVELQ